MMNKQHIHIGVEDAGRDYKNVHTDVIALEAVDLIQRSEKGLLVVPWDVIDAHVRLVA